MTSTWTVGERVELRDPPHATLRGKVVAVDEHAVRVRWDGSWDHQEPAIISPSSPWLHREDENR